MDEYAVLVDGVVRDALGLDGARGAGDAPAEVLTTPAWPRREWRCAICLRRVAGYASRCEACGGYAVSLEAGPSPCGE